LSKVPNKEKPAGSRLNFEGIFPLFWNSLTLIIRDAGASVSKGLIQGAYYFRNPFGPACALIRADNKCIQFTRKIVHRKMLGMAQAGPKGCPIYLVR